MKLFQLNIFRLFILPGALFGLYVTLVDNLVYGIFAGVFFGTFFGLAMNMLLKRQAKKAQCVKNQLSNEHIIIFDSAAYYSFGWANVDGWLYLTEDALLFKANGNSAKSESAKRLIPIHAISNIEAYTKFGVFPNGLRIIAYDIHYEFLVDDRDNWIRFIKLSMSLQIQ